MIRTSNTDTIADMLSRIRNGVAVNKAVIDVPYSKLHANIAKILTDNGYLASSEVVDSEAGHKVLKIHLAGGNGELAEKPIRSIKRLSKPGSRHYAQAGNIPKVRSGRGLVIVSTSQGLLSGKDASNRRLGGELICSVY